MQYVYVLNKHGEPLMPCSPRKARLLLKQKKACVIKRTPFTVKLLHGSAGYKQPVTLGVDAGSKHIGISATTEKHELYREEATPRNDVVDLLSARRAFRRSRRNRKTRYRAPRFVVSAPTNKVTFEGTDLSSYAAKSAATGEWMVTLPRALDLESNSTYVITNDMGDYNGHVYDVTSDGTVKHILLADLDVDTKATYQAKLEAVLKESYRLLSIGAGETDFSNVLLDSNEIAKCVPTPLENEDDVTTAEENARKKAIGASVTNVSVTPDDTLEGYPDAYTYRLDGNDGIVMDVKIKVSTTNGDARVKATINMRLINGAWKVVSIDSSKDIFTELSVLDPEW